MEELLAKADEPALEEYAGLQEKYERHGGYTIDASIERELAALAMSAELLERPFSNASQGERTRALIVALFLRPEVYPLIDEPTNHLDMAGRAVLGEYLAKKPGWLLVSHDRHFLELCADHVVALRRDGVRLHQGGFADWEAQAALEEESERHRREGIAREVRALEDASRKRRVWSGRKEAQKRGAFDKGRIGHLAARQMKRARSIEKRSDEKLEEKKELLRNAEKKREVRLRAEGGAPQVVLTVEDLCVERGGRRVLEDVRLELERGERVAVVGPNGCGKSSLLDAIAGTLELASGRVHVPGFVTIARAYQEPLWGAGSLRERLRAAELDETLFRTTMGSLGVIGAVFDQPLETFSEGERKKVDLCRSLMAPAHLFIWDEPMNYVDLASRAEIEDAILAREPTLLFVEHDRRFVERVATRVIELPGR